MMRLDPLALLPLIFTAALALLAIARLFRRAPASDEDASLALDAVEARREREAAVLAEKQRAEDEAAATRRRAELAALEAKLREDAEVLEEKRRRDSAESAERIAILQAFRARKPTLRPYSDRPIKNEALHDRCWLPADRPGFCVTFFTVPVGYPDPNAPAPYSPPKSCGDTSMLNGGRLSDPESFEAIGATLVPDEVASREDILRLKAESWINVFYRGGLRLWRRFLVSQILASDPTAPRVLTNDSLIVSRNESFYAEIQSNARLLAPFRVSLYLFGFHADA